MLLVILIVVVLAYLCWKSHDIKEGTKYRDKVAGPPVKVTWGGFISGDDND